MITAKEAKDNYNVSQELAEQTQLTNLEKEINTKILRTSSTSNKTEFIIGTHYSPNVLDKLEKTLRNNGYKFDRHISSNLITYAIYW